MTNSVVGSFIKSKINLLNKFAVFHCFGAFFITFIVGVFSIFGVDYLFKEWAVYLVRFPLIILMGFWVIFLLILHRLYGEFPTKWLIASVISVPLNLFFWSFLFLLVIIIGSEPAFSAKDFTPVSLNQVIGESQLENADRDPYPMYSAIPESDLLSPGKKMTIKIANDGGNNTVVLLRENSEQKIMGKIERAIGHYSWIQWTTDSRFLLSCFTQKTGGRPTDPTFTTYCFILDVETGHYSLLAPTEEIYQKFRDSYSKNELD